MISILRYTITTLVFILNIINLIVAVYIEDSFKFVLGIIGVGFSMLSFYYCEVLAGYDKLKENKL